MSSDERDINNIPESGNEIMGSDPEGLGDVIKVDDLSVANMLLESGNWTLAAVRFKSIYTLVPKR